MQDTHDNSNVKAQILETAIELFKNNGVNDTTLAKIATAANLSKGTLYYYYPTKNQLVEEIADLHFTNMENKIYKWLNSLNLETTESDFLNLLTEEFDFDSDFAKLHIALQSEAISLNEELAEKFRSKYDEWSLLIEVGSFKTGHDIAKKLKTLSKIFFVVYNGKVIQDLMSTDKTSLEDILRALL